VSANLDLVRSIYADWERGDFSSADWAHPEIEFEAVGFDPILKTTGVAAMAERWRGFMSAWVDYRSEADEYREIDSDRVLVLMQHGGRGKASGVGFENMKTKGANVFRLRDGKVTKLVLYWDRDLARADLGLEE
jgi:ketosteroid isomerase-like protein